MAPILPLSDIALQSYLAIKPLALPSIGKDEAFQPLLRHCSSNSSYLNFFFFFRGPLPYSLPKGPLIYLVYLRRILNPDARMFSLCALGKINLVTTSTLNSQSEGDRMFGLVFTNSISFVPALLNCITLFSGFNLFVQMALHTISAIPDRAAICNVLL